MTGKQSDWTARGCGDWRGVLQSECGSRHRGGTGWVRGGVAVCAARDQGRTLRDAAGAVDAGAPDRGLRGTGVFEFAEVRQREYRALAAERGNAAGGVAAAPDCSRL